MPFHHCALRHSALVAILLVSACTDEIPPIQPVPEPAAWRWMAPVAQGVSLSDVWGASADDLFATGLGGVVLRYDGTRWRRTTTPTTENLNAVWGSSGADVIAVGNAGTILRYDGSRWTTQTSGTDDFLLDVWGSAANDVVAVGAKRTVLHFDGAAWSPMAVPAGEQTLNSVWGSGPSDVYATGLGKNLLHYDGAAWGEVATPAAFALFAIWGSAADDVVAVGVNGAAVHYDGVAWAPIDVGPGLFYSALSGAGGSEVYAVGLGGRIDRWDGATWTRVVSNTTQQLDGVCAVDGRVVAVGQYGTIVELAGAEFVPAPGGLTVELQDVWMNAAGDAFAVGDRGTIVRLRAGVWEPMESGTTSHLRSIHGISRDDLVAVGRGGMVLRFDGASWTSSVEGPGFDLLDVFVLEGGEAYAVGAAGLVLRSQGGGWVDASIVGVTDSLLSVWGATPDDVYAVGGQSRAFKWNGLQWKLLTIDASRVSNYHAVHGTASDDVYVGAEFLRPATLIDAPAPAHAGGLIYHFDGASWAIQYQDPIHDVLSIWAASRDRAFACGDAASLLVSSQGAWTRVRSLEGLPGFVTSVWGTSPDHVLVVGDNGTVARYSR